MPDSGENMQNCQSKAWTGQFGDEYVERNQYAEWKIAPGVAAFKRMLNGIEVASILEVGSNIGLNLMYIDRLLGDAVNLYAVEPNRKAFEILNRQPLATLQNAWNCDVFNLANIQSSFDLVFTSGVLIHIAPDDLAAATDQIVNASTKFVLCIEYFAHTPVEVPYRGNMGLLFKRDFGSFYLDRYPQLKCLDYGFLWQREFNIFDDLNWWLFEKRV